MTPKVKDQFFEYKSAAILFFRPKYGDGPTMVIYRKLGDYLPRAYSLNLYNGETLLIDSRHGIICDVCRKGYGIKES